MRQHLKLFYSYKLFVCTRAAAEYLLEFIYGCQIVYGLRCSHEILYIYLFRYRIRHGK